MRVATYGGPKLPSLLGNVFSSSPLTHSRGLVTVKRPLGFERINGRVDLAAAHFFANIFIANRSDGSFYTTRRTSASKDVPLSVENISDDALTDSTRNDSQRSLESPSLAVNLASKALTCQSSTESQALHPSWAIPKQKSTNDIGGTTRRLRTDAPSTSTLKRSMAPYLALTKPRLSALVVLSAMSSYALTSNDATLSQLLFLTLGTAMTSGSANAINMGREYVWDGMMTRTKARPVVRGILTPTNAFSFAAASGVLGVGALYFGVNPTVAALGATNIVLYGWAYTSLKRVSILNTWVGAVVGAIPPLMGWAASSSLSDPGAWILAGLLYAWQFPHFNSLSHSIREEYRRAGYKMTAWTNPALNSRVALRYSIAMFPLCTALCWFQVTDWFYAVDSALVNGWLTYWALKFWQEQRNIIGPVIADSQSRNVVNSLYARKLFWGSVWHLPGVLVLAMLHKKGQWDWLWPQEEFE